MTIKIPTFNIAQRIVTDKGTPTSDFLTALNAAFKALINQGNTNEDLIVQIREALEQAGIAVGKANAIVAASALTNSYVSPDAVLTSALTGTTASITVIDHTRHYGDGTLKAVTGGTISGLAPATVYYVYYDDPTRAGGAVTFAATVYAADAGQVNGRHCVGTIQTAAVGSTGTVPGISPNPPGVPSWKSPVQDGVDQA